TTTVSIIAAPSASISYAGSPFCKTITSAQSVTLVGTANGMYSSTSGLSISSSTGNITPSISTAGTYTVTYTIAALGGCSELSTTASVTINTAPSATINYYSGSPWCRTITTERAVTQTGSTGGVYSASPAGGLSVNASTGAIIPSTSTAGTYTVSYTLAASGGCSAVSTTASVTITAAPNASISYAGSPFCKTLTSAQSVTQTGTIGGTYSSTTGLSINASTGAITPSSSTAGTYTVVYTIAASGGCSAVSTTTTVTITTSAAATISYTGSPWCKTITTSRTVTRIGTSGGTYSALPSGLMISSMSGSIIPSSSAAGTYTVSYTLAATGGCAAVIATATVTITAA
ncbi:MAG: adhesin, partial [Flavobacteriales bacterium]|nr:adhesin [Flavobacteriales bacterium]